MTQASSNPPNPGADIELPLPMIMCSVKMQAQGFHLIACSSRYASTALPMVG
jgi:hypothetical protein